MIDLNKVKEDTNASIVLHTKLTGNVIASTTSEHATNVALMSQAAFSMCGDLLTDLAESTLEQLIAQSEDQCFIINKLNDDELIMIACEINSSFGWIMKYMNSIKNN